MLSLEDRERMGLLKTLTLSIEKELTNDDRVNFVRHFFESDYSDYSLNTITRKSTLRKFLSSIFGKEKGDELIGNFWDNSEFILGEGSDLVTIVWGEDGPTFPVDKFKRFLAKVNPELTVTESSVDDVPRIEFLKYIYARAISSEYSDDNSSIKSELTIEEVEALVDVNLSMKFGYKYFFDQFECDTCKNHDENHPIHIEFQRMIA